MRIALLHSFYTSAVSSGENVVVTAQFEALASAGHDVVLIGRETDREQEHLSAYPVRAAWRTLSNRGPDPEALLRRFAPDVVHVHNTVPNIGLQWLPRWNGPLVHTLHNYRPLCANGLLFRDGRLCTDCPDGEPWAAVEHACYRDSRAATLPIAIRNARGVGNNPLLRRADALIVLSHFAWQTYTDYGVAPHRLHLIPNGVSQLHHRVAAPPDTGRWLAVGRLRAEKGWAELLAAWPPDEPLDVIGDGPQRKELEDRAGPAVRFLGQLPSQSVRDLMPAYSGLVFTGLAPESACPLVVIEALEAGLPVLMTFDHPQGTELFAAGVATPLGDRDDTELTAKAVRRSLASVVAGGSELREHSRAYYLEHFTMAHWLSALTGLYEHVRRPLWS